MTGVSSLGVLIAYSSVLFAVKVLPGRTTLSSPLASAWRQEFGWTEVDTQRRMHARQDLRPLCPDAYDQVGARPMFCFATACKLLLWAEYAYEINITAGQGGGEQTEAEGDNGQQGVAWTGSRPAFSSPHVEPAAAASQGVPGVLRGTHPGCTSPHVEPAAGSQGVPGVLWGSWLRQAKGREEGSSSDTSSCAATVKGADTGVVTGEGLSQEAGGGMGGGGTRVGGSEDKSGEHRLLLLQPYPHQLPGHSLST